MLNYYLFRRYKTEGHCHIKIRRENKTQIKAFFSYFRNKNIFNPAAFYILLYKYKYIIFVLYYIHLKGGEVGLGRERQREK